MTMCNYWTGCHTLHAITNYHTIIKYTSRRSLTYRNNINLMELLDFYYTAITLTTG